jgi:hypothetical protein
MKSTDCILIMGRRGCGKSYLCKKIQSVWPRRIIIDSLSEYTEGDIVFNFFEFTEKLKYYKANNISQFEIVYQFDPENELSEEEFNQIMRVSYYFGNVQVVIEECQLYSNPHKMPKWLKNSLLTGRHQNMSLLFTTQRPAELHKTILSQCTHIFCGQILEGNDLRYLSSFLGRESDKLPTLPERNFLYFTDKGVRQVTNEL